MGLLSALLGIEKRAESSSLNGLGSLAPSVAGNYVTADAALRNTTVLRCVAIVSQSLASVPLVLYRRDGRQRTRAYDHPVHRVLGAAGNREMTAYEVREARLAHCMVWGNAYAEIQYDSNYQVRGLWPLAPDRVGVERNEAGRLVYTYWSDSMGQGFTLPEYRVMHLRYTVIRGVVGISPIKQAMNALGVAAAAEEFGGRYFAQGSRPSIILKHPSRLSNDAYARLRESFANNWQGLENAHRINILEEGITPETVGIPPEEAQFLETRQFQVQEIARLYGVPLHMLATGEGTTFASAEQDAINFRQFTLLEWAKRDEQRLQDDLLTDEEQRQGLYIEYLLDGLERATIDTRTTAYSTMIQNGIMMPNEARERENLEPLPGGDVLLLPLNMQQIRPDGSMVEPPAQQESIDTEDIIAAWKAQIQRDMYAAWTADVQRRLHSRIANDVRLQGAKLLRSGGRVALSEWGETQIYDWRKAGEAMLAPLTAAGVPVAVDIGAWVTSSYQAAVKGLIDGAGNNSN